MTMASARPGWWCEIMSGGLGEWKKRTMADQKLLTHTLSEFAATLVKDFTVSDVLHDLAERAMVVVGADGAGVSLQHDGHLRFATALDERCSNLERVQESEQAGPCVDALRTDEAVVVAHLAEAAGKWGAYGQAARDAGIAAILGVPMRLGGQKIGTLNIYSNTGREWSEEDLGAARVLADIATSYVINASKLAQQRRLNEQLQEALDSRVVIEQAKGILAAERGISTDEAFQVLRGHARSHRAALRSVAEAVVNLGLRP
jgi:GAF domain-containing protein